MADAQCRSYACRAGWYERSCDASSDGSCDPRLKDQILNRKEGLCYKVGVRGACGDALLVCPTDWITPPDHLPAHAIVHKPRSGAALCYSVDGVDYYATGGECPSDFADFAGKPWLRERGSLTAQHSECQAAPTRCAMPDVSKPMLCRRREDCAQVTLEQVFDTLVRKTPDAPVRSVAEMFSAVHEDLSKLRLEAIESDEDKFEEPGFSEANVQRARQKVRSISLSANWKSPSATFTGAACRNFADPDARAACDRLFDCVDGACRATVQMGGEYSRTDIPRGVPGAAFCQNEFCREAQGHCPKGLCALNRSGKCVVGSEIVATSHP